VTDEDDASAGGGHRPQRPEQLLDFLRGEDRRGLVHDEDARTAVEHLENLDALLLPDAELPDLGSRIDPQPELPRKPPDLLLGAAGVQQEARPVEPEEDVLGDRLRWDQREVLMDHAQTGCDRIPRRAERNRQAIDPDLALVRSVEPGEDVHERALAGTVLAQEGMNLARPKVEVDVVVGEDAGERLDDADRFHSGCRNLRGPGRRSGRHRLAGRVSRAAGGAQATPCIRSTAAVAARS
jgi:hypothetical protein